MKKAGISLILLFLSFTLFAQSAYDQDEEYTSDPKKEFDLFAPGSVFQLDLTRESVIIGTGLLLNGTWLLCDKGLKLNHERLFYIMCFRQLMMPNLIKLNNLG